MTLSGLSTIKIIEDQLSLNDLEESGLDLTGNSPGNCLNMLRGKNP